jgi:hypothetical protein
MTGSGERSKIGQEKHKNKENEGRRVSLRLVPSDQALPILSEWAAAFPRRALLAQNGDRPLQLNFNFNNSQASVNAQSRVRPHVCATGYRGGGGQPA